MAEPQDQLHLEQERVSATRMRITARWQDRPVHVDTFDPGIATARDRFVKAVVQKAPALTTSDVDQALMQLVDTPGDVQEAQPDELDLSSIVRPEMFHTPEVSGASVPIVVMTDEGPAGRWTLYLRHRDGRRERRQLTQCVKLPDSQLWVHPLPGEPSVAATCSWSVAGRQSWLAGNAVPDPGKVFQRICERIAYFVDLPADVAPGTVATLALWIVLSYCYSAWDAVPYLYIGGPLGSGKSRVFEILARLVFRPLLSSNLTGPALFRTLHDRGGVLLFDEAERLRQATPDVQELLSMLLAGYKRGGQATRLEKVGEGFRPTAFDVYGPKALACIAGLPAALSSRCIPVMMFRAPPDSEKPRRRIDEDPGVWQHLRDELQALALEHGPTWPRLARRTDVCPNELSGRDYELWQPLFALAAWIEERGAEGLLALLQRHAREIMETNKDDSTSEVDEALLAVLAAMVQSGETPTPQELLNRAQLKDATLFSSWGPAAVSRRLKTYGIHAKKSHGIRRYRDVTLEDLRKIQRHYGIDLGLEDPTYRHPPAPGATPAMAQDETPF